MYGAMRRATVTLPPDVEKALPAAYAEEFDPLAKMYLETFFKNVELAGDGKGLVCGDTGFPVFFLRINGFAQVEGGMAGLRGIAEKVTARLTDEAFLWL